MPYQNVETWNDTAGMPSENLIKRTDHIFISKGNNYCRYLGSFRVQGIPSVHGQVTVTAIRFSPTSLPHLNKFT